jgi:hypothetical protein
MFASGSAEVRRPPSRTWCWGGGASEANEPPGPNSDEVCGAAAMEPSGKVWMQPAAGSAATAATIKNLFMGAPQGWRRHPTARHAARTGSVGIYCCGDGKGETPAKPKHSVVSNSRLPSRGAHASRIYPTCASNSFPSRVHPRWVHPRDRQETPQTNEGDGAPRGAQFVSRLRGVKRVQRNALTSRRSIAAFSRPGLDTVPASPGPRLRTQHFCCAVQRAPRARPVVAVGRVSGALRVRGLRSTAPIDLGLARDRQQKKQVG